MKTILAALIAGMVVFGLTAMIIASRPKPAIPTPNQIQVLQQEIDGLKARVLHLEKITGITQPHILVVPKDR